MIAYVILFLIIAASLTLLINANRKQKRIKKLVETRALWGKPKSGYFNFDLIENYSKINDNVPFHELAEQTIKDIDFYDLFSYIDRTTSKVGQQFLFDKLKKPTNDIEELNLLIERASFFQRNVTCREHAQMLLSGLNKNEAYFVCYLLKNNQVTKPKWTNLLFLDSIATIGLLLLLPFYHPASVILIFIFAFNLFLHFKNRNNIFGYSSSIPPLNLMIDIADKLCKLDIPFDKLEPKRNINNLREFKRKSRLLNFGQSLNEDISQILLMIWDLIKILLLIEVLAFNRLLKLLKNRQSDIYNLYQFVGNVDTAISVASLHSGTDIICVPEFVSSARRMSMKNIYHPLITDCVVNTINIEEKSILIMGSNMSGKTTFLRTVAINSILAQTIHTCFAENFVTAIFKQYSSIRIDDDLHEGKSYYLSEVETIKKLIDVSVSEYQNIFLLDEVFKGTNTSERVAGAKAILSFFTRNENIVIVATHDVELSLLLEKEYQLYHFEDEIKDNQLVFDHMLKPGPLKTHNAISILALSGYPDDIIAEAKRINNDMTEN